ncbi:MAG TPA: hypothetical protein VFZ58_03280 [Candidatus Saccharimonadales bacterium]
MPPCFDGVFSWQGIVAPFLWVLGNALVACSYAYNSAERECKDARQKAKYLRWSLLLNMEGWALISIGIFVWFMGNLGIYIGTALLIFNAIVPTVVTQLRKTQNTS